MIGTFSKNNALFSGNVWYYAFISDNTATLQTAKVMYAGQIRWNFPSKTNSAGVSWGKNTTAAPVVPLILKHGDVDKYKHATDAEIWFDYDTKQWRQHDGYSATFAQVRAVLKHHKVEVPLTKLKALMDKSSADIFQQILEWHTLADKYKIKPSTQINPTSWTSIYNDVPPSSVADSYLQADGVVVTAEQTVDGTNGIPLTFSPESFDQTYKELKKMIYNKTSSPVPVYSWILRGNEVIRPVHEQAPEIPF